MSRKKHIATKNKSATKKSQKTISKTVLFPPSDVFTTLGSIQGRIKTVILDPWYNKGTGGVRDDYHDWLSRVVAESAKISTHIFLWGFPEIVAKALDHVPGKWVLVAWLTWYHKNCPSVIRGWRSSQLACLHFAREGTRLYPEHFLNEAQLKLKKQKKLRYMPGPPSVIEAPLIVGWAGKNERTGHPAQKPMAVIEPLIKMTTKPGDVVLDPMCGSGTTGEVCQKMGRHCILGDKAAKYVRMTEKRLNVKRWRKIRTLTIQSFSRRTSR